jgi:hypothetical protein
MVASDMAATRPWPPIRSSLGVRLLCPKRQTVPVPISVKLGAISVKIASLASLRPGMTLNLLRH